MKIFWFEFKLTVVFNLSNYGVSYYKYFNLIQYIVAQSECVDID